MPIKEKVVIADDHALIRNGLLQVLESFSKYEVIQAKNGKEALELIQEHAPSLAILDIEMPVANGFEVAKFVKESELPTAIIFLTMYNDEEIFNQALDIGVKGYVLKENTVTEIIRCIEAVEADKYYLSPAISDYLLRREMRSKVSESKSINETTLTESELRILGLVADMLTNPEIAAKLNISIKTVQNHRSNICNKLDLKGAHALLKYAVNNKNSL
jgi:DNA-binding NarL/FixJ family response regulator